MGSEATGPSVSSADGFSIGGCSPAGKKVTPLPPPPAEPPALAALVSSSSSLAGLWRLPPHISSRRFGGEASIGARLSTVPSVGRNQLKGLLAKPRSSNCAALTARI